MYVAVGLVPMEGRITDGASSSVVRPSVRLSLASVFRKKNVEIRT